MELLNEMVVFARVVDTASFSQSARELGLTTSAVSRSVARLERHMGARLLQRTTRSVTPTEIGREVYVGCARISGDAREVIALANSYADVPRGKLKVSVGPVLGQVWLTPTLPSLFQRWPDLRLALHLDDRTVDIVKEGFDVAIRIATHLPSGMASRRLFDMSYVLVAAPMYLAQHAPDAHPDALSRLAWLHLGYGSFTDRLSLTKGKLRSEFTMHGPLTVSNSVAMLALVEAGVGIGVMPDFVARQALSEGRVVQLLTDWVLNEAYETRPVHVVYAPTRYVPRKVRAFIDHLVLESSKIAAAT